MKAEFTPDGSIKSPNDQDGKESREEKTIRFTLRAISDGPLIDELHVMISEKVDNPQMIESLFNTARGLFKHMSTELSMKKISTKEYTIRIVSGSHRGTWIQNFVDFVKQRMNVKTHLGGSDPFRKGSGFQGKKRTRVMKGLRDAGLLD